MNRVVNRLRIVTVVVLAAGVTVAFTVRAEQRAPVPAVSVESSSRARAAFLDQFVDPDGRVVRRDQGGDTVSEGEAYALLLAVSAGDRPLFDRVLAWTDTHIRRADGLLAWHWRDGAVVDGQPATDADLDAATALADAAARFGDAAYAVRAREMAAAILQNETVTAGSKLVLVAGPWATADPVVVNPSYWSPRAFLVLGALTGDPRWQDLRSTSRDLVHALTTDGAPPDWAVVDPDGSVRPSADGSGRKGAGSFGFDAARVTIRWASSCDPDDRAAAALPEPWLRRDATHDLRSSPMLDLAEAGAASGAGDRSRVDRAIADARSSEQAAPTYYSSAWLALAEDWLGDDATLACGSPPAA